MKQTRYAVRVPHTMRAWYAPVAFPSGRVELMTIISETGDGIPSSFDTTFSFSDIEDWGLLDCARVKVEVETGEGD